MEAASGALKAAYALSVFLFFNVALACDRQNTIFHTNVDVSGSNARDVGTDHETVIFFDNIDSRDPVGRARSGVAAPALAGLNALQIALYKVGMPWPLEPAGLRRFCAGLDLVLVVEEKRGLIEPQLKELLHGERRGPRVIGKRNEMGDGGQR